MICMAKYGLNLKHEVRTGMIVAKRYYACLVSCIQTIAPTPSTAANVFSVRFSDKKDDLK